MHFSCGADPAFAAALEKTGRRQVIVVGMETHVCVFQTMRDLVAMGYEVHVCSDAVSQPDRGAPARSASSSAGRRGRS